MLKRKRQILAEVKAIGKRREWDRWTTKQVGILALMCVLVESGAKIYANKNVSESFKYPHDAIGEDHDSVGAFQQRTPMWGTCEECMSIKYSTRKFVHHLMENYMVDGKTLTVSFDPHSFGAAVQTVQGSEYPNRYQEEWKSARNAVKRNFLTVRTAK